MKSFIVLCVMLISFCSVVQDGICAIELIRNATHPDYPEQCFYNDSKPIILRKGQKKRDSKECVSLECLPDYTLMKAKCGHVSSLDVVCRRIKGDPSKPYPRCCDEIIC